MFNSEAIKNLAHSNTTSGAIFLALSQRERPRRILNVTLLKRKLKAQGVAINDKEFFLTFKALEKMQLGDLIYGRKGNADVFVWYYDLLDVATAGLGEVKPEIKAVRKENRASAKMSARIPMSDITKALALAENETKAKIISNKDGNNITISIPLELLRHLT